MMFNTSKIVAGTAGVVAGVGTRAVLKTVIKAAAPEFDAGVSGKIQKATLAVGTYVVAAVVSDVVSNYVEHRVNDVIHGIKEGKRILREAAEEMESQTNFTEEAKAAFNVAVNKVGDELKDVDVDDTNEEKN